MLLKYADDEMKKYKERANDGNGQGEDNAVAPPRSKFKYVDGVERLADMPYPFLIDMPNGSTLNRYAFYAKYAGGGPAAPSYLC